MNPDNTAAHSLPSDYFPFTVELFDGDGELLWEATVEDAGVLRIPGFDGRAAFCHLRSAGDADIWTDGEGNDIDPPSFAS